jgi:hypothetical protein
MLSESQRIAGRRKLYHDQSWADGGYVVFGFDHTIPNLKGRDFKFWEMHSLETVPVISVPVPVSRELLWWPMTETKTESPIMTSGTKLQAVNILKHKP